MAEYPIEGSADVSTQARDPDFPFAPGGWNRDDATAAAREDGLSLNNDHWGVLRALQEYFARKEHPNVRELHDALDEKFHPRGGMKFLYEIFPGGPVAQGCRLAGLPIPAGAVDKSFGSVQ